MFGVHGLCGTHNIWCRPLSRGLTLSGMATSRTFHVTIPVGLATLRLSEGCIAEVNTATAAQAEVVDSCHGRVSGINKICFLCSSYCRSQATTA